MRLRQLAARCLSVVPHRMAQAVRAFVRGRWVTILTYHRVLDKPEGFAFDDDLISASATQFEHQLDFISKHYTVVNFGQLKQFLDHERHFPPNALIITFDDGYVDNYQIAFPILRRYGMTAVFFVVAGFIGTTRLFWWDKIAYIIKRTKIPRTVIEKPRSMCLDLDAFATRQAAARHMIGLAKHLPNDGKEALVSELSLRLDVPLEEKGPRNTMTWDEVREMSASGFEIGAHSVSHPLFSGIDPAAIRREVEESKGIIERMIGKQVVSFGAPGRGLIGPKELEEFASTVRSAVQDTGYSFSTLYREGLTYEKAFDPFGVARLGVESQDGDHVFKAKLAFPEVVPFA